MGARSPRGLYYSKSSAPGPDSLRAPGRVALFSQSPSPSRPAARQGAEPEHRRPDRRGGDEVGGDAGPVGPFLHLIGVVRLPVQRLALQGQVEAADLGDGGHQDDAQPVAIDELPGGPGGGLGGGELLPRESISRRR